MSLSSSSPGGLKGLIQRSGKFFFATGVAARDWGTKAWQYGCRYGGQLAFVVATSTMVTLVPLMFEVAREAQGLETERALAKDYKSKGFSSQQLQEMGFSELALHSPSVASLK